MIDLQQTYTTETKPLDYHTMDLSLKEVHLIRRLRQLQNAGKNVMLIVELKPKFQWRCTSSVEG